MVGERPGQILGLPELTPELVNPERVERLSARAARVDFPDDSVPTKATFWISDE